MLLNCFGCGVSKDTAVLESYPYDDDNLNTEKPGVPMLTLDCDEKAAVVCYDCFHRIQPDMWIDEACWQAHEPEIPYERLPPLIYDKKAPGKPIYYADWNPERYWPLPEATCDSTSS